MYPSSARRRLPRRVLTALLALTASLAAVPLASPAHAVADDPVCYRGPSPAAYYKITNVKTGKSLNVARKSKAAGAPVIQWTYAGGTNEQWRALCVAPFQYKLVARHSGLALDLAGGGAAADAAVIQNPYTEAPSQKWGIWRAGQSGALATFQLYNQGTGKVIDAGSDGTALRQAAIQDGNESQVWTFEEVGPA
ncbi:RICIN domain-containing protein [Actinoplanes sp. NEAU-A12]|uniref:RICIN domain-containing protein n=1 Tax=Actinoplanes sandaracinus TaxID=3045177 RepID=A0ABT6WX23_9ACTN|nr:RICIN domain-containing protein [Actinoplanes sandaracinus]MDI6104288.1 RICIN domain-containing protein [Actinoplanes sandaracinus]